MLAHANVARAPAERRVHPPPPRVCLADSEWSHRIAARPHRRFSSFQEAEGELVIDMGARAGRTFAAERRQDSVNLFEATAERARALAGAGKRVLFASWSGG